MQTQFSLAQLADSDVAQSEQILRACVHCGFCTATCPTYVLLGDELDSPRGRIYLIKEMLEQGRPATADVVTHVDRCLSCLACMTTCPSGVNYMHLVDHARAHIETTYRRPLGERLLRWLLASTMPHAARFRWSLRAGRLAKPFFRLVAGLRLERLTAALQLVPARLPATGPAGPRVFPAEGPRRGRVALLSGCVARVLAPQINDAAIRVLTRHGIEVVLAKGEGCCGSLAHHMGRKTAALAQARANIDAWLPDLDGFDAILVTASGCGTTVKDYGFMLRDDHRYAAAAAAISERARDISEYLYEHTTTLAFKHVARTPLTVAYHAACSLQHGQKIFSQPKILLSKLGFVVKDIPEGHLCCGSAGTYNILQPRLAGRLLERKAAAITTLRPDVIAAGNIGCIAQLAKGTPIPIVHPVELVDWVTGGPIPPAAAGRVRADVL